jgi:prepilin-type N-terminal cleavage/methylation domain-containing protein
MNSYSDKTSEDESQSVSSSESQKQSSKTAATDFVDNRPEALAQRELQEMINGQSKDAKLDSGLDTVGGSPKSAGNANWEKLKSKIKNKSAGFTLIELLVVISIIGLLSTVVLASVNVARANAADAAIKSEIQQYRNLGLPGQLGVDKPTKKNRHLPIGQRRLLYKSYHQKWRGDYFQVFEILKTY